MSIPSLVGSLEESTRRRLMGLQGSRRLGAFFRLYGPSVHINARPSASHQTMVMIFVLAPSSDGSDGISHESLCCFHATSRTIPLPRQSVIMSSCASACLCFILRAPRVRDGQILVCLPSPLVVDQTGTARKKHTFEQHHFCAHMASSTRR